ncbi:hypothetical protein DCC81_13420 [Chitinophaga parva]|uniref:Uncharacterized protein n=1 Tax=Chitinophaga parva TaxID=2169414 RepID=A0A2T7BG92_9BACT|nr:hypothetical protein [Chitinophaga parva]PUZ25301.1 hypothetical protein DCC81_13420 [Chitinophaga parva]
MERIDEMAGRVPAISFCEGGILSFLTFMVGNGWWYAVISFWWLFNVYDGMPVISFKGSFSVYDGMPVISLL